MINKINTRSNNTQEISFKQLYATKRARECASFLLKKSELKRKAVHYNLYFDIVEKSNKNNSPVLKFLIKAEDLKKRVTSKVMTKDLAPDKLDKAANAAIENVQKKIVEKEYNNINKMFEDIFNFPFGK